MVRNSSKQNRISKHCLIYSYLFSLLPYSEPDQDVSPNNDTDWDWGKGGSPGGSLGGNGAGNVNENTGLTDKILSDTTTVISKSFVFLILTFPFKPAIGFESLSYFFGSIIFQQF